MDTAGIPEIVEDTSVPQIILEKANQFLHLCENEIELLISEYQLNLFGYRPRHLVILIATLLSIFIYSLLLFLATNFIVKSRAKKHTEMKDKLETLDFNLITLEKKKANSQKNFHLLHLIAFFFFLSITIIYLALIIYNREDFQFRPLIDSILLILLIFPIIGFYITNGLLTVLQNRKLSKMKRQFLDIYKDVLVVKENMERTHELSETLLDLKKKIDTEWNPPQLKSKPQLPPPKPHQPIPKPQQPKVPAQPVEIPKPIVIPKPLPPFDPKNNSSSVVLRKPSEPSQPFTPDHPTRKAVHINNNNANTPSISSNQSPFVGKILSLVAGSDDTPDNKKNNNNNNNQVDKKVSSGNNINNIVKEEVNEDKVVEKNE